MAQHKLSKLFEPQSIAVVGASERDGSLGRAVWQRLHAHAFAGRLFAVNPKHRQVAGEPCVARMTDLAERVDLALVTAPAAACAQIVRECGASGCHYALILSHGFDDSAGAGKEGLRLAQELRAAALEARVRLIGPNARGLVRPRVSLDASAMTDADTMPASGSLAVLSQSGAWLSILRDYSAGSSIGFSSLLSLGASLDLDFGELLDFFAFDAYTADVLLYIEEVKNAPAFMSGVRQISRMKPVVVLKADRADLHRPPDGTHATALAQHDRVFEAAIARAGAVRVQTAMQMVSTARLLAGQRSRVQQRVVAITNGRGPGLVAADAVRAQGLALAPLSETTYQALRGVMPAHAWIGNPLDLAGDATAERYRDALQIVLADDSVDVCLVLFSPQSIVSAETIAEEIIGVAKGPANRQRKTVLAVMGGGVSVLPARALLDQARIPQFLSAENAVDAIGFLETFARNQSLLRQVPEQSVDGFAPHVEQAEAVFERVWSEGRRQLYAHEARQVLGAFGIAMANTAIARTPAEAVTLADSFGYPVVLKVVSPDISHKTEAGGVQLDLRDAKSVRKAARAIFDEVATRAPAARVLGLTVQPFVRQRGQRELYLGLANDPTFGVVMGFGAGGIGVERLDDVAFELPPVNDVLIANLIARTRVSKLLDAYSNVPAINRDALTTLMLRFSTLACACPEIAACDLNPVIAYEHGVIAVDARIVLRERDEVAALRTRGRYGHLAVYPYPRELEEQVKLKNDLPMLIRPIQPEDAEREREFVSRLSPETLYFRFMMPVRELPPAMIERFTQIDYGRELALVGITGEGLNQTIQGVARITPTTVPERCEFAIVVAETMQGTGLARALMSRLFDAARARGYREIEGVVLRENPRMLKFCEAMGFTISSNPDDQGEKIARRMLVD